MNTLESIVNYYKEHKTTLLSQLVAWPLSTVAAAYSASLCESPAKAIAVSSAVAQATYWPSFIAGKVLGDRKEFVKEGKLDRIVLRRKIGEYASWWGAGELVYAGVRSVVMGGLSATGMEEAESSATTDLMAGSAYTLALPFMEDAIYRFNKMTEEKVVQPVIEKLRTLYRSLS